MGAWSTYFSDSIRLMIRRLATSWIKCEIIFIAFSENFRHAGFAIFWCRCQIAPYFFTFHTLIIHPQRLECFTIECKEAWNCLSLDVKESWNGKVVMMMTTLSSSPQLHNLQHKIGFLLIVFEQKEPLKIYFTTNHHKSTSPSSCNFIYGQLFKKVIQYQLFFQPLRS